MTKKLYMIMMTALMIGLMAACGDADVSTVDNDGEAEAQAANENEETEEPEFYKPDETVSVDGVEITLEKITWGEEAEFSESENGQIARIELAIKNNSDDNEFIDDSEFDLYDEEGNKLETYYGSDDANMFGSEIKQGKQMKGVLEYDVPESEGFELYYEPSFSFKDNSEIIWKLDKGDFE